jgi:hypothetical protein
MCNVYIVLNFSTDSSANRGERIQLDMTEGSFLKISNIFRLTASSDLRMTCFMKIISGLHERLEIERYLHQLIFTFYYVCCSRATLGFNGLTHLVVVLALIRFSFIFDNSNVSCCARQGRRRETWELTTQYILSLCL